MLLVWNCSGSQISNHVTNDNGAQRRFCVATNQKKVRFLDYGQKTCEVNVSD